ncbi:hypothetical protein N7449_006844 [Penicillium cf. viridicatum]|uniref:Uncharacterized protein n=1 Tax=Penicillium cf. viridicatum TaxID=2972119 RepID=A0A9W9JK36_9EURO|nr:hypothetical protein N7449_006844 [Penicillium cf. viridicatum]
MDIHTDCCKCRVLSPPAEGTQARVGYDGIFRSTFWLPHNQRSQYFLEIGSVSREGESRIYCRRSKVPFLEWEMATGIDCGHKDPFQVRNELA